MDSRTDLPHTQDELGMLAKFFDDMAEMLERRNVETQIAVSALRETEERYQTLSEATLEGVAFTEKGLLIDASSYLPRLLGYQYLDASVIFGTFVIEDSFSTWTGRRDLQIMAVQ